jgi:hypothetical protein
MEITTVIHRTEEENPALSRIVESMLLLRSMDARNVQAFRRVFTIAAVTARFAEDGGRTLRQVEAAARRFENNASTPPPMVACRADGEKD